MRQQGNHHNIQFHYLVPPFFFPERTRLKLFLAKLCKQEGHIIDHINYIFCNDEYLYELNKDFLKHNTYTDIITFQLNSPNEPLLADIYISVTRVKENARLFGSSMRDELLRVIFHGALHLCGYKDKTKVDKKSMRKAEDKYLNKWTVSRETD